MSNRDGAAEYYIKNIHGDVVGVTDESGNVINDYYYDAFGNEQNVTNDNNPFRYAGEYYDEESGNLYLRNRYYDSSIGRFITEDPAKDGLNWYIYCENNPVNFVDPNGQHRQPITEIRNGATTTTAVREDIRELLKQFNGVLRFEGNNLHIMALWGHGVIDMQKYNDGIHKVDGHFHFSYGEFFELLGLNYEKTSITVQVNKMDENKSRLTYAVTNQIIDIAGETIIKSVGSALNGLGGSLGKVSDFLNDLMIDPNSKPPVIPEGTYVINEYTVEGKVIIQQRIGTNSGNNYYDTQTIYYNIDNPAYILEAMFGWERP